MVIKLNINKFSLFRLSTLAKSYTSSYPELQIDVDKLFEKYMDYKEIFKPMVCIGLNHTNRHPHTVINSLI